VPVVRTRRERAGSPVVNDPAAASDAAVQRTYLRSELEVLWQASSGGAFYLVYPPDRGPSWPW
jgi:hypothetical protein